ncbi:hypothetical protein RM550_27945 [Streptomyces sp. DSM 41527]|uniref:PPE domain-containing protein n=1 Tax=Streptomyces mooreae TaxID=3075523 RepID=A0ABU2TEX4_9ACTN|nr:hypothetical protein [Streptomyces sp. DSM 41527]MDT0459502.1 hypothetical protein [Streptomyces sp. DSM 41527]
MSDTPANSGNEAYEKTIKEKNRKEQIKEDFGSYKVIPKSNSDFHHHGLDALRAMVKNSHPDAIESAGDHWRASADLLAGEDGRGGIRKAFMDAVDHASAHWHGAAADAFRRESQKVLSRIDRTYGHARNVETSLIGSRGSGAKGSISHSLREAKTAMSKIEDAGTVEGFFDTNGKDGDDAQFHKDMANPKMDAKMALELNRDSLSLSKERQVEAVIVMEELANNYRAHPPNFSGEGPPPGSGHDWPTEPRQPVQPAPVNMPTPGGPRVKPSKLSPHAPSGPSAPFDPGKGHISPSSPPVRTGLDGLHNGTLTPAHPTSPGPSVGGGGHVAGGGGGGSAGMPGGAMPVMPGKGGGSVGPVGGSRGGAMGGRSGSSRAGMPGGAGAGRAGMPGGGMGGGAGGGAGRGGAAGRSGAQARTRGGMAGKPGTPTGGTKQGGSGLHRSRGGTKAGQGMAGAPGAKGNGKGEKERTTKQRPDYLIEDEETWTPQRNVAPRVIE